MSHDRSTIEADPPGGHIRIAALNEGAERSRITLTSTVTGEVFADVESRHVVAPSLGDDWNTATAHATEVAAALYWSMWRMQQLQDGASGEPRELLSSQRKQEKQGPG